MVEDYSKTDLMRTPAVCRRNVTRKSAGQSTNHYYVKVARQKLKLKTVCRRCVTGKSAGDTTTSIMSEPIIKFCQGHTTKPNCRIGHWPRGSMDTIGSETKRSFSWGSKMSKPNSVVFSRGSIGIKGIIISRNRLFESLPKRGR